MVTFTDTDPSAPVVPPEFMVAVVVPNFTVMASLEWKPLPVMVVVSPTFFVTAPEVMDGPVVS